MQLYIGSLSDDITEDDVKEFLGDDNLPQYVKIIRDIESGKSRGFAIVKTLDEAKGKDAINHLNGASWHGKKILVRRMPETLPGEMELREWLVEHAARVLEEVGVSKAQTVLDYGCGSGIFTIPAARTVGQRGKVYAFETRSNLLEQVVKNATDAGLGNVMPVSSDSSKPGISLPDKSINIILVYDVMHEIADRRRLLQELHRVLKDDGILSVFPMHLGTQSFMDIIKGDGIFCLRNRYGPSAFEAASEVLNFKKCQK